MGEVYRARDSKLHRDVALKILPDLFTNDPERLARFAREAQLLASLNHAGIGQIYGLEEGARSALVLELVEGSTLADRIARGPIPVDEKTVLRLARRPHDVDAHHDVGRSPDALGRTPLDLFPVRLATVSLITTASVLSRSQYDVAADGRFLVNVAVEGYTAPPISSVLNWDALVKKEPYFFERAGTASGVWRGASAEADSVDVNRDSTWSREDENAASCVEGIGSPGAWRECTRTGFTNPPPFLMR